MKAIITFVIMAFNIHGVMGHNEAVRTIVLLVTLVAGAGAQTGVVYDAADFGVGPYFRTSYLLPVVYVGLYPGSTVLPGLAPGSLAVISDYSPDPIQTATVSLRAAGSWPCSSAGACATSTMRSGEACRFAATSQDTHVIEPKMPAVHCLPSPARRSPSSRTTCHPRWWARCR